MLTISTNEVRLVASEVQVPTPGNSMCAINGPKNRQKLKNWDDLYIARSRYGSVKIEAISSRKFPSKLSIYACVRSQSNAPLPENAVLKYTRQSVANDSRRIIHVY